MADSPWQTLAVCFLSFLLSCLLAFYFERRASLPSRQVLPCLSGDDLPDGVVVTSSNRLPYAGTKVYEICTEGDEDFQVRAAEAARESRGRTRQELRRLCGIDVWH